MTTPIPLNNTLYVNSINDKIPKLELKKQLYMLFSQYGRIIDIVAMKGATRKGQAFIVFQEISEAVQAKQALDGFVFFSKALRIQFAKTKSESTLAMEGNQPEYHNYRQRAQNDSANEAIESSIDISNRILFIENLPDDSMEELIANLFNRYKGFKEVRMVPGKSNVAFVEFEDEFSSSSAKSIMNHFKVDPTHELLISFAKK